MNPSDFIITRKRKKYRFALFANSELCYEHDDWDDSFRPDVIEVGAGNGLFSVELARRYPERRFAAVDVKADRLQKGARAAEAGNLNNIRFLRSRADLIGELFKPGSVKGIWLTFPDPFPRDRSAKHRLTHPRFLELYRAILDTDGQLLLKHDNLDFFHYSIERLVDCEWRLQELTFDLHESDLSEDYRILTTYEKRWLNEGATINFVRAAVRG